MHHPREKLKLTLTRMYARGGRTKKSAEIHYRPLCAVQCIKDAAEIEIHNRQKLRYLLNNQVNCYNLLYCFLKPGIHAVPTNGLNVWEVGGQVGQVAQRAVDSLRSR